MRNERMGPHKGTDGTGEETLQGIFLPRHERAHGQERRHATRALSCPEPRLHAKMSHVYAVNLGKSVKLLLCIPNPCENTERRFPPK